MVSVWSEFEKWTCHYFEQDILHHSIVRMFLQEIDTDPSKNENAQPD